MKIWNKSYSELIKFPTFEERFKYLMESKFVGDPTFGGNRYLNQDFYHKSKEWKKVRDAVIIRDNGKDLGIEDRAIVGKIIVHHMVPITKDDILFGTPFLLDPEYLICCSMETHNAIHFGDYSSVVHDYIPRKPNDTCPWR